MVIHRIMLCVCTYLKQGNSSENPSETHVKLLEMKYYVNTKPRLRCFMIWIYSHSTALHEAAISVLVTTIYGRWHTITSLF